MLKRPNNSNLLIIIGRNRKWPTGPEVTYFIPIWASCLKSFLGVDICNFFSSLSFRLSPYLNIKTWKNIFSIVKFNFKIFLWPIHCWPWTLPSSHMITLTILPMTLSRLENLTVGKMKRIFIIINKKTFGLASGSLKNVKTLDLIRFLIPNYIDQIIIVSSVQTPDLYCIL